MTGDGMTGCDLLFPWGLLGTDLLGRLATGMEMTASGREQGAGHLPLEDDVLPFGLHRRIGDRHGRQQGPGIGMQRIMIEIHAGGNLHQLP